MAAWTLAAWSFPGEHAERAGYPAAFPEELPRRLIELLSRISATWSSIRSLAAARPPLLHALSADASGAAIATRARHRGLRRV
jgi:hypothetical protein